ncbi:DUF6482 family protein [Corallincola platygyrae]|uniref:DUF6482 family protein n=1 Tax=Corallincola platygyrae TaxID=1193278 RepID=A0ABW4XMZ3_9GAMM
MQHSLDELDQVSRIDKLELHSLEGGWYQAEFDCHQGRSRLVTDQGRPIHFQSIESAKEALNGVEIQKATLVFKSAYDEMIGTDSANGPIELPLIW